MKKEPFFNTINWENLSNTSPPFIPVPDNDSDTFYFEGILENIIIGFKFLFLARNKAIGFDEESVDYISM